VNLKFLQLPDIEKSKEQHSCCIVVIEVIGVVVLFPVDHKWCPAVDSSCGNNNWQLCSESVTRCCGTDRFHIVRQWRQANSCTCTRYLQSPRDTFLLLHMDYCDTSILEHNDMNIVSDYTDKTMEMH